MNFNLDSPDANTNKRTISRNQLRIINPCVRPKKATFTGKANQLTSIKSIRETRIRSPFQVDASVR